MSVLDNSLQTRSNPGYAGNFRHVNQNYYLTNQASCSENLQTENLFQSEGTEQNLSSPTSSGKCV